MTRKTLRNFSLRIGKIALLVGLPVFIGGLWIGNPVIIVIGCAILSLAAYTMAFSVVGAAL